MFWGFAKQLTIYLPWAPPGPHMKAKATFPIRLGHGLNSLPRQTQEIIIHIGTSKSYLDQHEV